MYKLKKPPPPYGRGLTKCVFIGLTFITRWLNDVRMLTSGSSSSEGDEERQADTSKATEDIGG